MLSAHFVPCEQAQGSLNRRSPHCLPANVAARPWVCLTSGCSLLRRSGTMPGAHTGGRFKCRSSRQNTLSVARPHGREAEGSMGPGGGGGVGTRPRYLIVWGPEGRVTQGGSLVGTFPTNRVGSDCSRRVAHPGKGGGGGDSLAPAWVAVVQPPLSLGIRSGFESHPCPHLIGDRDMAALVRPFYHFPFGDPDAPGVL